jgi:hypothetical protein
MKHEHSYRLASLSLVAICGSFVISPSSATAARHRSSQPSRAWTNEAGIQHPSSISTTPSERQQARPLFFGGGLAGCTSLPGAVAAAA